MNENARAVAAAVGSAVVLPVLETVQAGANVLRVMYERDDFYMASSLQALGEVLTFVARPMVGLSSRISMSVRWALASSWPLLRSSSSEQFVYWFDSALARAQNLLIELYNILDPVFNVRQDAID